MGMLYLHNLKAFHRDLKLANLLLHFPDMNGKENEITIDWLKNVKLLETNFIVKIADLGFSKIT
jgi:serine/threonine protein kinase